MIMRSEDLSKLKEPFKEDEYEWRTRHCGITDDKPWAMVLCYVTNRAIMDRLDTVCGPENWQNTFQPIEKGMLCGISINIGSAWITKYDGSQNTDVEATKGGISGAMKRAAVQWGIGRLLYRLESNFVEVIQTTKPRDMHGWQKSQTKKKETIYWKPPRLPDWAVSKRTANSSRKKEPEQEQPKTETPSESINYRSSFLEMMKVKAIEEKVSMADMKRFWAAIVDDMGKTTDFTHDAANDAVGWGVMEDKLTSYNIKDAVKLLKAQMMLGDKKKGKVA